MALKNTKMTKNKVGWEKEFDEEIAVGPTRLVLNGKFVVVEKDKLKQFIRQILVQELRGLRDEIDGWYSERNPHLKVIQAINQRLEEVR